MNKFYSSKKIIGMINDGMTIAALGMSLAGVPEEILQSIEDSFLKTGHPRGLTLLHSSGQSNKKGGIQHLAHEGLLNRIIGSHWGLSPLIMQLIAENKVEAYCIPQGQCAQLYRSMACGLPGKISKVGLGTFIDPRVEGGKMNDITKKLPDYSKIIKFEGEEYIFYPSVPLDMVIFRGTTADERGNITCEEEALKVEILPAVLAAKRFGGKVIAQVKRIASYGSLNPRDVVVPGVHIDAILLCKEPDKYHRQTSSWTFNPAYSSELRIPYNGLSPLPLSIKKVIGRRAMMELTPDSIINLGTGIPNDVVGLISVEESTTDLIVITLESGVYSGIPATGVDFGIAANADAIISHDNQFDFYNGTGVDFAFMGGGELDEEGNVNATKLANRATGTGGFIDITTNAKTIMFCSTFTAKGLEIEFQNNQICILKEGKIKKLVKKVSQISFNGKLACKTGRKIFL